MDPLCQVIASLSDGKLPSELPIRQELFNRESRNTLNLFIYMKAVLETELTINCMQTILAFRKLSPNYNTRVQGRTLPQERTLK